MCCCYNILIAKTSLIVNLRCKLRNKNHIYMVHTRLVISVLVHSYTIRDELPLLAIGKSCFKSIKYLPVTDKNKSELCMTSRIFEEWLR